MSQSERIRNIAKNLVTVTQEDVDLVNDAVKAAVSQSGGGEDDPMTGVGAGAGTATVGDLSPMDLTGTPYDLTAPTGSAELAAMIVGEGLNAVYRGVTSETVKYFSKELLEAGDVGVEALDKVVVGVGSFLKDVGGAELGEATVDTVKEAGSLGYWTAKLVGGALILAVSMINSAIGTSVELAKTGSNKLRSWAKYLRSRKTKEANAAVIIENSPLAILTAVSIFNQLGMLPLVTIAAMGLQGIKQQFTPMGRSMWIAYLFKWWVTRSAEEKEQVQEYTKEVLGKAAEIAKDKAAAGAVLVAAAIKAAAEARASAVAGRDTGEGEPPGDSAEKLKRALEKKPAVQVGVNKGAARVFAGQAAAVMGVLDLDEQDVAEAPGAAEKLRQLKIGVAKAVENVGKAKEAKGKTEAEKSFVQQLTKQIAEEKTAGPAARFGRSETRSRSPSERRRMDVPGSAQPPSSPREAPKRELRARPGGRGGKGGKRTKKNLRKTYRKKKGMMKKTRKFIY